jgi:hypothetical protein
VAFRLRERATLLGMRLMGKMLEDPRRAEAMANFFNRVQRAKAAFDERQRKAFHAAGLVTRDEFKAAGKRLSQLKRRCAEMSDELDRLLERDG